MTRPDWRDSSPESCAFRRRELMEAVADWKPAKVWRREVAVQSTRERRARIRERIAWHEDQIAQLSERLARPRKSRDQATVIAELEHVAGARGFGEMAEVLGYSTPESLARNLARWGRPDLIRQETAA